MKRIQIYIQNTTEHYRNVDIQWDFWKASVPFIRNGFFLFKLSQLSWVRSHTYKIYTFLVLPL